MFHIAWCFILPNDGHEIAETYRRYMNFTVVFTVCANLSCINKIKKYTCGCTLCWSWNLWFCKINKHGTM